MLPHHALPLGHRWGLIGGSDIKQLPIMGHLTKKKLAMSNPHSPTGSYMWLYWGIIGHNHFAPLWVFDIRVCQLPTIAPYNPEGSVGQYIHTYIF